MVRQQKFVSLFTETQSTNALKNTKTGDVLVSKSDALFCQTFCYPFAPLGTCCADDICDEEEPTPWYEQAWFIAPAAIVGFIASVISIWACIRGKPSA